MNTPHTAPTAAAKKTTMRKIEEDFQIVLRAARETLRIAKETGASAHVVLAAESAAHAAEVFARMLAPDGTHDGTERTE